MFRALKQVQTRRYGSSVRFARAWRMYLLSERTIRWRCTIIDTTNKRFCLIRLNAGIEGLSRSQTADFNPVGFALNAFVGLVTVASIGATFTLYKHQPAPEHCTHSLRRYSGRHFRIVSWRGSKPNLTFSLPLSIIKISWHNKIINWNFTLHTSTTKKYKIRFMYPTHLPTYSTANNRARFQNGQSPNFQAETRRPYKMFVTLKRLSGLVALGVV